MKCGRVREIMFLVVDNEMGPEMLVSVRAHLERCPTCAEEMSYTIRLITVVRQRCGRAVAPERLRNRILESLRSSQGLSRRGPE